MRRLAIYQPGSRPGLKANVFGATVANFELFRAMATKAGLDELSVLTDAATGEEDIRRALLGPSTETATRISTGNVLNVAMAARSGSILRGSPKIDELAWHRRQRAGPAAYSLIGLIHTIAPPMMRQDIAAASVAPVQPWDALVCTSPSVQRSMVRMFDQWEAYLAERTGGRHPPRPALPVIPLGVDGHRFARSADRPDVRNAVRRRLGLADADVLVIWVGRLSFFEKAFPQPMFRAVAGAAAQTGVRVHFAMLGWFPGKDRDEARYREAAASDAPEVPLHFLDGNDRQLQSDLWAAGDVFLSLVDNIQETFGITPVEAMAAGMPVVVSDWDGYRYTVRHGTEGFLIPTLGGGSYGLLDGLADAHAAGHISYQNYVGTVAQHTAVSTGAATEALVALIASSTLRRSMGAAGRERVRTAFDWSVVAPLYADLAEELGKIRRAVPSTNAMGPQPHPVRGDPFADFVEFPTRQLTPDTLIRLTPQAVACGELAESFLNDYAGSWRATREESRAILSRVSFEAAIPVRDLLEMFPVTRRKRLMLTLQWLCKQGLIAWEGDDLPAVGL